MGRTLGSVDTLTGRATPGHHRQHGLGQLKPSRGHGGTSSPLVAALEIKPASLQLRMEHRSSFITWRTVPPNRTPPVIGYATEGLFGTTSQTSQVAPCSSLICRWAIVWTGSASRLTYSRAKSLQNGMRVLRGFIDGQARYASRRRGIDDVAPVTSADFVGARIAPPAPPSPDQ